MEAEGGIPRKFNLQTSMSMNNMVLFNQEQKIKKY